MLILYIYLSHKIHQNSYTFPSFLDHLQGVFTSIEHIYNIDKYLRRLKFLSINIFNDVFIMLNLCNNSVNMI